MDEPGDVDVAAYPGDSEMQFLGTQHSRSTAYGPGDVVRFEHDLFTSADVKAADIVARGVVVTAAAYMLERAGLRTEITARLYAQARRSARFDYQFIVKGIAEPLVLSKTLYWLAHPSVLRILLHQIGAANGNDQSGYYRDSRRQLDRSIIQTPDQYSGTHLDQWLSETLTRCGLRVK